MVQLKIILERLKNPSVIISIASQIVAVLLIFNVDIDRDAILTAVAATTSIMVLLGIISNPDTKNHGYGEDFYQCSGCHEVTAHLRVGESMVCSRCGCVNDECADASQAE